MNKKSISNPAITGPLAGIKVLDMSRILAGPTCTQLLGDYGADVIKVEKPGIGDDTRQWGPPWLGNESGYFMSANRNKRSITVDISSNEGQDVIKDLVKHSDILIENYKIGTLARYGISSKELLKINPKFQIQLVLAIQF